jgi:hypothetical protein
MREAVATDDEAVSAVQVEKVGEQSVGWPPTAPPAIGMHYLQDEYSLSERLGVRLEHPVRLFDVEGLGVRFAELRAQILPSFPSLPWDTYDVKREQVAYLRACRPEHDELLSKFLPRYFADDRALTELRPLINELDADEGEAFEAIRPYRRRAVASFIVRKAPRHSHWRIDQQEEGVFTQKGDDEGDYRKLGRRFAASARTVTGAPSYRAMIDRLATIVDELHGGSLRTLRIVCHQMGLVARPARVVSNAPEGIHQDGSDYIVSALVLERRGIEGGESVVFGPDKRTEYLRHTLREGQGLFQADAGSPLWHWVTPVRRKHPDTEQDALRNILGYDVQLD